MAEHVCRHHGRKYPCTCAMGHLYRFVEPVFCSCLRRRGIPMGTIWLTILQSTPLRMPRSNVARSIGLFANLRRMATSSPNGMLRKADLPAAFTSDGQRRAAP